MNEFGIYELADEQPSADPGELADLKNAALPPTMSSDKEAATNVTPAVPLSAAAPVAAPAVVEAVKTTTKSNEETKPNGDRERWKQKFPSNTKVKVDIVCCKQCDGIIFNKYHFEKKILIILFFIKAMGSLTSLWIPITVRKSVGNWVQHAKHIC